MSVAIDIGIEQDAREGVAEALKLVLADTYTLYLKTHYYHWNVTGPRFTTLHNVFEEHYNELWLAVDDIAERIRTLGVYAPGSYKSFAKLSSVLEDGDDVPSANDMVANLTKGHETVAHTIRDALKRAEEAEDEGTADLLVGRLRVHEKTSWMLRSMLEEK